MNPILGEDFCFENFFLNYFSRRLKKESKPSKFEYNPELSEEDNKRIEQLYKENEERNKLIDDMLKLA